LLTDAVTNVKIYPNSGQYSIGDQLNCTADGIPTPNYKWQSLGVSTPKVVSGQILRVTEEMVNTKHTFQCQAFNVVAGERKSSSENITFSVTGKCDNCKKKSLCRTVS